MDSLLEKTRGMNRLIQDKGGPVDFEDLAAILSKYTNSSVYIVGKQGKLLGLGKGDDYSEEVFEANVLKDEIFSEDFSHWLMGLTESRTNYQLPSGFVLTSVPVKGGGERVATLLFTRKQDEFSDDETILAEYAATITGLEILRLRSESRAKDAREKAAVQLAVEVLSFSELEAVKCIFTDFEGEEGFLVASKIADKYQLTRSVIVNALRKLESAGVIDSRSLGMKGTYIKVLNNYLFEHLKAK